MALSPRERQVLALLRAQPLLDAAGLARTLGTTRGAVSVILSSLSQKGEIVGRGYVLRDEPWAVVIGGAAWDVKARSLNPAQWGTSNPSTVSRTPGGVGRNIAESIARLGSRVHLVAAVGSDQAGAELVKRTAEAGVYMDLVVAGAPATASYLAALDASGELLIGLSDFAATEALGIEQVSSAEDLLAQAAVLVVDANIPQPLASWILGVAAAAEVRVVIEPVSVTKAGRIAPFLSLELPVFAVTPNVAELGALLGRELADDPAELTSAAEELRRKGVDQVWISRGAAGSLLVNEDGATILPALSTEVLDVTGAGDALTAGFVHGLLQGEQPVDAARRGHLVAAATVASHHTVRPDLGVAVAMLAENEGDQE